MTAPRLLLAEDDPVSRAFLHEALAGAGYRLLVADDGGAALALARREPCDGLLLDLNLPGLDGPELLRALRADPAAASRAAPALALTAAPDPRLDPALSAAGFRAVLGKPIAVVALRAAVAALLAGAPVECGRGLPVSAPDSDWDESRALAAANGDAAISATLRAMLLAELPQQRARVVGALAGGDRAAAGAELHRLRASCGICGAARLAAAVDALAAALAVGGERSTAEAAFDQACARLLVG